MIDDTRRPGTGASAADVAAFVAVIRAAFGTHLDEQHGPAGGYELRWSRRGLWKISLGGLLDAAPLIEGPAGYWKLLRADRDAAVYALQVLAGVGAVPASAGTIYDTRPAGSDLPPRGVGLDRAPQTGM